MSSADSASADAGSAEADAGSRISRLTALLTPYRDWPKPGIVFRDIFPVFRDPNAMRDLLEALLHAAAAAAGTAKLSAILGLEARGFLLGPSLAMRMNCAFVPVRKAGKLPGDCHRVAYDKEYGSDAFEIQADSIAPGSNVIVFDDVIATGGTFCAAIDLAEKCEVPVKLKLAFDF
jgi:adenine phosphoribosyltransferase